MHYSQYIVRLAGLLAACFLSMNAVGQISDKEALKFISTGRVDFLEEILLQNPDIDKEYTRKGITLLNHAVRQGNFGAVKILLDWGADINKENRGNTPLINAILKRQLLIFHFLIRNGAGIDLPGKRGNTPLIIAAKNGRLDFVKILIENGAETQIKNNNGLTALDFANMANYPEVAKYLVRIIEMRNHYQNKPNYSDGPHIKWINDTTIRMIYMEYDTTVNYPVFNDNFFIVNNDTAFIKGFAGDNSSYKIIRNIQSDTCRYENVSKIIAIGDVHGHYNTLVTFLHSTGIIDENQSWAWGDGHLVMLGDIFDRGNMVTETLWLLYRLDCEARQQGGRVHLLLGNHEIMVMLNDVRYLNEKYKLFSHYFHYEYVELFDEFTLLGQWLRTRNTVITINGVVFTHAGISPAIYDKEVSIGSINNMIRHFLANDPNTPNKDATITSLLLNADGPLWFRGYYHKLYGYPTFITDELVASVLEHYNGSVMVIAHTEVDTITPMYNNRIIGVDVPIRDDVLMKEVLLIEDGRFFRLNNDGSKEKLF
jgi:hypothetical protein